MSLINEAIADKLDPQNFFRGHPLRIADLGCSVGPNTFATVKNIINSVQLRYQTLTITPYLEFQVFFNDHASNDFSTLFKTLPPHKEYFAAGVPGSFYTRLFPSSSVHVIHSSFALHWLSKVPEEVLERGSIAWNKGRVHYAGTDEEVVMAYMKRYVKDMEAFLKARAEEVVCGGLVVVLVPGRPNEVPHSECIGNVLFEVLGCCLLDMAKAIVYDHDVLSKDDPMGDAKFDIKTFVEALKMPRLERHPNGTVLKRIAPGRTNCLAEERCIIWKDKEVVQHLSLRLKNFETGEVEIELCWVHLQGCKGL